MPPVAVRDIAIHPRDNDVIVATHGRGIYILDDAAPLQMIGQAVQGDAFLFPIRPAIRWAGSGRHVPRQRARLDRAEPAGGRVDQRVPEERAAGTGSPITITDKAGKTVRTIRKLRADAGVNRFVWDLRYADPAARGPAGRPGGPGVEDSAGRRARAVRQAATSGPAGACLATTP